VKYFSPKKARPGQWTQLSARALDFRRGHIPTRETEQFSTLTVRLVGTGKGWRRLWVDDVAVHECPLDALRPPRTIPLTPDTFLSAESAGDANCVGVKLRRSGVPGQDLLLFRGDAPIDTAGVSTDAAVCVLTFTAAGDVSRFFAHQATRLTYKGARMLACSRPADAWFELGPRGTRGVVEASVAVQIAVGPTAKPEVLLVNGKASSFSFDPTNRVWRAALEKGRSRLLASR